MWLSIASETFALANSIGFAETFLLSGPSGSGRFGKDEDEVCTALKYFRIPAILFGTCDIYVLLVKLWMGKLWRMAA